MSRGSPEPLEGVQGFFPPADLEVEHRAGGGTGVPHLADRLPGGHFFADLDADLGRVGVERVVTAAMIEDNTLPIALEPVDVLDPAPGNGLDRGPEGGGDVDAAIEGIGAETGVRLLAESLGHAAGRGPGEPAPVLPEVPEEGHFAARGAPLAGETSLLQRVDEAEDPLSRL